MAGGRVGEVPSLSAMSPTTVDRGFNALSVPYTDDRPRLELSALKHRSVETLTENIEHLAQFRAARPALDGSNGPERTRIDRGFVAGGLAMGAFGEGRRNRWREACDLADKARRLDEDDRIAAEVHGRCELGRAVLAVPRGSAAAEWRPWAEALQGSDISIWLALASALADRGQWLDAAGCIQRLLRIGPRVRRPSAPRVDSHGPRGACGGQYDPA